MLHSKDIFRKYDIRGIYGKNLTADVAELSARAFASMVIAETGKSRPKLSVGRDVRASSEPLFGAVCRGLAVSGIDIIDIGVCPSPLTYFSMHHFGTDGYIMITGSHNPPEFNGIKVGTRETVYHSDKIEQIYENIISENFPSPDHQGTIAKEEIIQPYLNYISEHFSKLRDKLSALPKKLKIVVDSGSGTASDIAPLIFHELGCEVLKLWCEPDGTFPGHHPDPTVEKNMADARALLLREGADLAVGFDGDADRLGALDSRGEMIWGDQLIGIFASDIAAEHQNQIVVADVKASKGLYEHIDAIGMKPVMYLSGHSMIKVKMKEVGAVLGGEMSSHFFFADRYFGYDDGIYAAVRLLEAYADALTSGKVENSSQLTDDIPKYVNTPEIREPCPDDIKFRVINGLESNFTSYIKNGLYGITDIVNIDGLRITFEKGWALVRASNTEPLMVTRYEAVTREEMEKLQAILTKEIIKATNDIQKKN